MNNIDKSETGLYSKIIFCLMAKLGVNEITITSEEMKALAGDLEQIDVRYQLNVDAGYVKVSYGPAEE